MRTGGPHELVWMPGSSMMQRCSGAFPKPKTSKIVNGTG